MPGGVSSPVRAFGAVGGTPRFAARGEGAYVEDADGRRYLDLVGSWGPLILGHAHPEVVEAIVRAARDGTSFGAPTEAESELAERIIAAMPAVEQVRLTSSGTEAAMSAIRLARAATGRDAIVKMAGCYHGHADALLASAGSGVLTHGIPGSPGIPRQASADTFVVPFNDADALAKVVANEAVAAVILEPIPGNMGVVPPDDGYLEAVRAITAQHGVLLVFDEVMTGFRVGYGGAQDRFGVAPDLTVLGKIVGGGMPLAAYGGRLDLMQRIAPAGDVYQAGTLSGNPVCVAAGIATLDILRREDPYPRLEQLGRRLEDGLRSRMDNVTVQRAGSMLTVFFTGSSVRDLEDAKRCDTAAFARWFHHALDSGVWWPPSQFEAAFLNTAMTDADIDRLIDVAASPDRPVTA
jgi:glutamate-1-semialdehyde 2,1-aminomutase